MERKTMNQIWACMESALESQVPNQAKKNEHHYTQHKDRISPTFHGEALIQ
jgi:hypothetical protein